MWAARSPSPLSRGQASQPEVKQKGKGKGKSTVIDIEDDIDMKEGEYRSTNACSILIILNWN